LPLGRWKASFELFELRGGADPRTLHRSRSFQLFSRLAGLHQANRRLRFHARSNKDGGWIYNGSLCVLRHPRHMDCSTIVWKVLPNARCPPRWALRRVCFSRCATSRASPDRPRVKLEAWREIVKVVLGSVTCDRGTKGTAHTARNRQRKIRVGKQPGQSSHNLELSGWPILG